MQSSERGNWTSRLGFIFAAAGSAVGLGNLWRFPYVTGENGGGLFVLVYLGCILLVGLPIMIAEVMLGRHAQQSPVAAFRQLAGRFSAWLGVGWLGVAAGFVILSFYSVVSGWTIHYLVLSLRGAFIGRSPEEISAMFGALVQNPVANVGYHAVFMALTTGIVIGGVSAGIERWTRVLMPGLLAMLVGLGVYGLFLPGFGDAVRFVFGVHADQLRPESLLVALGQAFFSLSLGMGAMLTYGSYLPRSEGIPRVAATVVLLDTVVALLASVVVFPITFSHGLLPSEGPGLVFQSIPSAFATMPGGMVLSVVFFSLLVLAALTSTISLLEVVSSTVIDLYKWNRRYASLAMGGLAYVLGIPSALSGSTRIFGAGFREVTGRYDFMGLMEHISSDWMLPLGGLLIAIYCGFFFQGKNRRDEFTRGGSLAGLYPSWLTVLRYVAPLAVLVVMAQSTGLLAWLK